MGRWILALALIVSSAAAELKWAPSYEEAFVQAKKENKNVMVMLSREECPACEYMNDVVFEEKAVAAEIHKYFVPVYIDIHKDFVPEGLGYIGTPTFHFLKDSGKKIGRHDGAENIPNFLGIVKKYKK